MHLGELALFLKLGFSSIKWGVTPILMGPPSLRCRQADFRVEFWNCGPLTSWMSPTSPCLLFFFAFLTQLGLSAVQAPPGPSLREAPQALACPCCVPGRPRQGPKLHQMVAVPAESACTQKVGWGEMGPGGAGTGRGPAFLKGGTFFFFKKTK